MITLSFILHRVSALQEEFQRLGEDQRKAYKQKIFEALGTLRQQQAKAAAAAAAAAEAAAAAKAAAAAAATSSAGHHSQHKRTGRLDGDCTLIASFSRDQITKHLNSLRDENPVTTTPEKLRLLILPLIDKLLSMQDAVIFAQPVDWLRRGLMDYPLIVLQPMDLGTIRKVRSVDMHACMHAGIRAAMHAAVHTAIFVSDY